MLRRPEGATIDELVSATGWQRHTVRGVFSGTLKKKLGLTLARPKRSAAGSTALPRRRARETRNSRCNGSPAFWRAVVRHQLSRRPEQWAAMLRHGAEGEITELADKPTHELRLAWRKVYRREPPLGLSRDLVIRALANKLQERAYGGPSGVDEAPPDHAGGRVRERRSVLGSWCRTEDGREAGAAVARTRPHCPRARGRLRVRGPALSFTDDDCRTDHGCTLVGPSVLRRDEANLRSLSTAVGPGHE